MAHSGLGELDFEQLETVEAPSDTTYYLGVAAGVALVIISCTS
jgi:hypothetical protein